MHASEDSVFPAAILKRFFRFRLVYDMDDILSQRLEQVGVGQVGDLGARNYPQPDALLAPAVELTRIVQRQFAVRRAHVARVAHRFAVLLLAEDFPHAGVSAVTKPAGFVAAALGECPLLVRHQRLSNVSEQDAAIRAVNRPFEP